MNVKKEKKKKTASLFCLLKVRKYIRWRFLKYIYFFISALIRLRRMYIEDKFLIFILSIVCLFYFPYKRWLDETLLLPRDFTTHTRRVYYGLFSSCLTLFFACTDFICSSESSFSLLYWTALLVLIFVQSLFTYIPK